MHNKICTLLIVLRHGGVGLFVLTGLAVAGAEKRCEFQSRSRAGFDLDECRPTPVHPGERAAALASLPSERQINVLNETEQRKMEAVRQVLRFHKRQQHYMIKVIDVPQAFTGLHERTVLLISRPTIQLLHPEELQALAAHEVGHEYVWDEYRSARIRTDKARLHELELVCDRIAATTLSQMMLPESPLMAALEKVFRYNRDHFGVAVNEPLYPSLSERRANIAHMSNETATTTSGETRVTFFLERFVLTLNISFLPGFRGGRLAFTQETQGDLDVCLEAGSELPPKCPEHFVGAVAIAQYSVRQRSGRPARNFNLRERVTTVDRHPDFPNRGLFERTVPMVKSVVSDVQAFGYDEDRIPKADQANERAAADNVWGVYRQELYANSDKTPFAILEWRHTIRSIILVSAKAVAPAAMLR
jgi:hypothetical protein